MLGHSGLYRRRSGIYAIRLAVPVRLRTWVGRKEIHVSTRLTDWNAAKLAALRIQVSWRERWMALDIERLTTSNPLLLDTGVIPVTAAAAVIGLSVDALLAEMLNQQADIYLQAENWRCWYVDAVNNIAQEASGAFVMNEVEAVGVQKIYAGLVRAYRTAPAISALISRGQFQDAIFLAGRFSAIFCNDDHDIPVNACFADKADIEQIRARLAARVSPEMVRSSAPVTQPQAALSTDPIHMRYGQKRFSELFKMMREDRNWGEDNAQHMTKEANLFIELMGDLELEQIEKETVLEYGRRLRQLPRDIYQSRRKYKITSIKDLMRVALRENLALKNESTAKRHVAKLGEILNYGVTSGMLPFNYAADYKRGSPNGLARRAQDEREVFNDSELREIFSVDWFLAGTGKEVGKGWIRWRPFHYWLPLLGLLTGARLNELSQLDLDDLRKTEQGKWYFDFNLDQPDKLEVRDKSLKTSNSVRVVPMHTRLIDLGLLEYVGKLRESGHRKLFPELTRDRLKGYSKQSGKWFNSQFLGVQLGIARNGKKTFHSLRHGLLTQLDRNGVDKRTIQQLAGHERGDSITMVRYVKDRTADELAPVINAIEFGFLAQVARFDVTFALKALKCSTRHKSAVARGKQLKAADKLPK